MGRPSTGKYDNLIEDIKQYTKDTEYPILKELCHLKHYNYDTIMKMQRNDEDLMQSIKELLYKKEAYLEYNGLHGKLSNTMCVFTLKQLGWRDNIQVETKELSKVDELLNSIKKEAE